MRVTDTATFNITTPFGLIYSAWYDHYMAPGVFKVLQIDLHERQNRQHKLIDIDEGLLLHIVFEHRTKVRDNVARPVSVTYNSL